MAVAVVLAVAVATAVAVLAVVVADTYRATSFQHYSELGPSRLVAQHSPSIPKGQGGYLYQRPAHCYVRM